jgi:hypothetical protein
VGPETQLDETVQVLIFLVTILEFLPSGMIKPSIDNKFGAINIAQQMSKTGILVVLVLSSKTISTQTRIGIFQPNSTAKKQMKTGLI